jgi:ABC-type uncharacterized transport system auxiliary subunit
MGGALLLAAGCLGVERSYPDKRYFVVAAADKIGSANPSANNPNGVLLVASLRVSPRYEGKSFVYRRSESSFESDFYNQFLVSPGAIFTEEVRKGLAAAGVFQAVIGGASQLEPTYVLEGSVNALYGDFRDTGSPKAVLEMEFFLTRDAAAKADIVTHRRYSRSAPVNSGSAEALARGWSQALDEILAALVADLKAAL